MNKLILISLFFSVLISCSELSIEDKFSKDQYCSDIEKILLNKNNITSENNPSILCNKIHENPSFYSDMSYKDVIKIVDSLLIEDKKEIVFYETNITLQKYYTDSTIKKIELPVINSEKIDFGIYYPWTFEHFECESANEMRAWRNKNILKMRALFMNDMDVYLEINGYSSMLHRSDEYKLAKINNEENLFLELTLRKLDYYLNNKDFKKAFYNDLKESQFEKDIIVWYSMLKNVHTEIVNDKKFIEIREKARRKIKNK